MSDINLIPAYRINARRGRDHRRLWYFVLSGYALALALVWVVGARLVLTGDDPEALTEKAATQILQTSAQRADLRARLIEARDELDASNWINERPDWSILLALIGRSTGPDVVISHLSLTGDSGPRRGTATDEPRAVHLGCLARRQAAVSAFALRLEQSGLFRRVAILNTNREYYQGEPAIAFNIECLLDTHPEATP